MNNSVDKKIDIAQIEYYTNLISEKIDLQTHAFIKRIQALQKGETERVEFIEKLTIEPLDRQIKFLAGKASELGKERNGQ